jgi:sortase A
MTSRPRINWLTITGTILIVGGLVTAAYPFSPLLLYELRMRTQSGPAHSQEVFTQNDFVQADEPINHLPVVADKADAAIGGGNQLIIEKIGVNLPIVEGNTQYALEKGAWRLPFSSHPDQVGNTILTGHRYKYRPPASNTLYLLNKVEVGDTFTIIWNGEKYRYGVDEKAVKDPNDFSLLEETSDRRVSIITCDPLFSTKNRLIVSGQLLK